MIGQGCYSWRCPCGVIGSVTFDLVAKRHDRTHQCKTCGRAVRVQRPIMLELVRSNLEIHAAVQSPTTGDLEEGDLT